MTLSMAKVEEVERLLETTDLSLREIAERTGVSRGSVTNIRSGERSVLPPGEKRGEGSIFLFTGPIDRCGECGGKVHMPCMACRLRSEMGGDVVAGAVSRFNERVG